MDLTDRLSGGDAGTDIDIEVAQSSGTVSDYLMISVIEQRDAGAGNIFTYPSAKSPKQKSCKKDRYCGQQKKVPEIFFTAQGLLPDIIAQVL